MTIHQLRYVSGIRLIHNTRMGFVLLCLLLWALIAIHTAIDTYGWLMLVAVGWFIGYVDAQWFRRWDQQHRHDMPASEQHTPPRDSEWFGHG